MDPWNVASALVGWVLVVLLCAVLALIVVLTVAAIVAGIRAARKPREASTPILKGGR